MTEVSVIFINGNVLTMGATPKAEAVAVGCDGRITAVGSDADLSGLSRAGVRVIDLRGRILIPGFFDCHLHIGWLGDNLGHVDLSSPPVRTPEDIVRLLCARSTEQPDLPCLQGNRYDQNKLSPPQHLTRH